MRFASLLLVAALAGCALASEGEADAGRIRHPPCDCSQDECVNGTCVEGISPPQPVVCANGESCPGGLVCNQLTGLCEPDAGMPASDGGCHVRCDCALGEACHQGTCVVVALDAGCAIDTACGRGQTCDPSHHCGRGCADDCDCAHPKRCSLTRFQCECPGPGTIEMCVPECTSDSDCQEPPYGGGSICVAGLCQAGCNVQQCQSVCAEQNLSCDTTSCSCTQG